MDPSLDEGGNCAPIVPESKLADFSLLPFLFGVYELVAKLHLLKSRFSLLALGTTDIGVFDFVGPPPELDSMLTAPFRKFYWPGADFPTDSIMIS